MDGSSTREAEASELFSKAIADLSSPTHDLKFVLRTCSHACTLLGWVEQLQWFQEELQGYPHGRELPWYRKNISGVIEWRAKTVEATFTSVLSNNSFPVAVPTKLDVRDGVPWIQGWAVTGWVEKTGKTQRWPPSTSRFEIVEQRSFLAGSFVSLLAQIEALTFQWVSTAYATLRYGNSLVDTWQGYRSAIDKILPSLGLTHHLVAIEKGLLSNNPQEWRTVLWSCRDILRDLASHLWQDARPTYEHLPGKRGGLGVTASEYVNRLGAYLHQKGITGTTGQYLRSEMERIYSALDYLNDLASTAHDGATLADARTVALGTYFLLGEFIQRTDMVPVTQYSDPGATREEPNSRDD